MFVMFPVPLVTGEFATFESTACSADFMFVAGAFGPFKK
jgi:hypothetical protein